MTRADILVAQQVLRKEVERRFRRQEDAKVVQAGVWRPFPQRNSGSVPRSHLWGT